MRSSSLPAFRPRRVLAVAGLLSLGAGLLMLTAAAHPVEAATSAGQTGAAAASAGSLAGHTRTPPKPSRAAERQSGAQIKQLAGLANADAVTHSLTTVTGPHLYNPATNSPLPNPSTVTVSQTGSLVNQQVQVSWANFTPSTTLLYAQNTTYAVMVAECKGTNPASPADCYGAENAGKPGTSGPEGPLNTAYGATNTSGGGAVDIEILTKQEVQSLGCDQSSPCSLVVVPAQGGNFSFTPAHCNDHSADLGFNGTGDAGASFDFGTIPNEYLCSWKQRIVIPLTFARTAATCSFKNPVFAIAGSPILGRALSSWVAGLCVGSHGLSINADSTISEPTALTDLGTGQDDVALTTRPASAQGISTGTKKYVYAPVGVTAISVAYWFDNPATGLPDSGIHLNQRLLLKLLTQSYAYENDSCPNPTFPLGCDNAVDHDPVSLFTDPEFLALNPDFASQNGQAPKIGQPQDGYLEVPTVLLGQSDMTWTVTSWIDANADAKNFLAGTFDPYGGHINTSYLNLTYPNNSFIGQDNYILMQHEYTPVFPLSAVATDQVENWPPATSVNKDPNGNFPRLVPQIPGQRALIAVLDQGDAAAFLFPTAAIPNGAGRYVEATTSHMLAALQGMTSAGQGTKQVNFASKNKKAYPLTMVVYAAVPTSGVSHTKAAAIARFLDFVAGKGQTPGVQPGQLPPGFAPLPASMRAQTRKDAQAVLRQTGAGAPSKNNNPNTGNNGSSPAPNPTSSPGSVALPTVAPSPGTGSGISLVNAANAQPASITRYILPALLILGGLAALAGSSSLIGSSSTPISARLRRIGQGSAKLSRTARSRLGLRRSK